MATTVYAWGLVYASACSDETPEDVVRSVNDTHPTGIESQWAIADEPFASGDPNPNQCEQDASRKHYLLVC